jgi:PAS domain-containing protein
LDSRGTERDTGQGRADASLDAILQCVALPVWVVDHAGVVVLANPAAPMRTGEPVHRDEDWLVRRDGSMFPVSVTATAADLASGRGVVMTFVDMSAQREAEQGLRERDAILARVAQPVWVVDHEGRFHYPNPAALAALGYDDPSDLVGKPGHETVH